MVSGMPSAITTATPCGRAPDNVAMAATALAIGAGGAVSSFETTVLLTVEETMAALQKASSTAYRPPGETA